MVQRYDPAGYLPGKLLPTPEMQWTYYAVRSFWVETGLRLATTAKVPPNSTPTEHLQWWSHAIDALYDEADGGVGEANDGSNHHHHRHDHPTLRLLQRLMHVRGQHQQKTSINDGRQFVTGKIMTRCHFDDILKGRMEDLHIVQYATMGQLEKHAVWSCGSLSQLVLEADGVFESDHPLPHRAAKLVGRAHGLTNALRLSIPVVSTTGKLVIPQDLCTKYGVSSPRYLLSALSQGDERCSRALQRAVEEIALRARECLHEARGLRDDLLALDADSGDDEDDGGNLVGRHSVAVLLPALTSQTFLDRLEWHGYDLTNRNLRNVSMIEHAKCSTNLIWASWQRRY
jgi:phytoene/squalene synthetase